MHTKKSKNILFKCLRLWEKNEQGIWRSDMGVYHLFRSTVQPTLKLQSQLAADTDKKKLSLNFEFDSLCTGKFTGST